MWCYVLESGRRQSRAVFPPHARLLSFLHITASSVSIHQPCLWVATPSYSQDCRQRSLNLDPTGQGLWLEGSVLSALQGPYPPIRLWLPKPDITADTQLP